MSPEAIQRNRDQSRERARRKLASMSPSDMNAYRDRSREYAKKKYASMSPSDKEALLEYAREKRASMSPSDREARLVKERERDRQRHVNPEQRAARSASKARTAKRKIAKGICVTCSDLATCGRFCFDHWLLDIGHKYGLTFKNGGVETLESLWKEQAGICALTGEKLIPGQNASIDHILPRCRGGANGKSNLQWVTKEVNYFKRARTSNELIQMSLKVVRHAERETSNVLPFAKPSNATGTLE
jgi:hypothetical protein